MLGLREGCMSGSQIRLKALWPEVGPETCNTAKMPSVKCRFGLLQGDCLSWRVQIWSTILDGIPQLRLYSPVRKL